MSESLKSLKMALQNISGKNNGNFDNNNENSRLLLEILKNRISNYIQIYIEKDAMKMMQSRRKVKLIVTQVW